ncbi:MAG: PAS domain S-box protein, partial [Cyanobacteria bacterium J06639_14]
MSKADEYLAQIQTLEKANRVLQRKLERSQTDLLKLEETNAKKESLLRKIIQDRNQTERQLQNLIAGTATTIGQDFFPALVKHLAEALNVSCAIVSERIDDKLQTLAIWVNGAWQPNSTNPFAQTPCERVFQDGLYCCDRAVQQQFPDTPLLVKLGAESYLGIALRDASDNIMGDLCILDQQPIQDVRRAEQILQVFAVRAAAELERQRAEAALQQLNQALEAKVEERTAALSSSEAQIRTVVDALPDLLLRVTRDGTCLGSVYSQNLASDFYPLVQGHLADVLPSDLLQRQLSAVGQALTTGSIQVYEHELTRHGHTVPEEVRVAAINPDEALIIVRNIRDRKQAEISLKRSEQRYASLAAAVPVGIFRTDARGQCIYVNDRWCQIAGITAEAASGQGWECGLHADDRDRIAAEWYQSTQHNRPFQLEYRFQRPDGQVTWVYGQSVAERDADGEIIGYVGSITDISDRKRAEAERLQAEQTRQELRILEQILDTVLAGYWDWDIPNHQEYLSPGWKRMFGYEDHELPNIPDSWQALIFPEDLLKVQENFERHIQSHGQVPYCNEVRYRHKDGSTVWVIYSGQVIEWDADGNPLRMVGCHIDISDRKQLELTVQASQKKLREVLDSAIAGIIRLRFYADTSIQYDYISPHCEKHFGYTVAELMPDASLWQSRIHPDDWNTVILPTMQAILNQREPSTHVMEYRFHRKDGSICWILANIFVQWNEIGRYWNVTIVDTDISDRKLTEEALRESEARWQFALEGAEDGVWDWHTQTNAVFYSRQWKTMLGYAEEDVGACFEDWDSRIHPEDKVQAHAALQKHLKGETPIYQNEHRMRCRDGNYKWILTRGKVIERTPDGAPLRVIGIHTDISDRRLVEQRIREQAALIDIATDAIWVRDLESRIVFWSQGAEQLYGWTKSEALGQCAHELFGGETNADRETRLTSVIAKGDWQGELRKRTKSGNTILVASRWTLVRSTSGQSQSLLVVDSDITEKKQLEAQFYQAQRLDSLGRLASGIAHDLNNVLTPILTMAQLLRLTQQDIETTTQGQLKLIEDSAKQGTNLVKQILAFTRGEDEEQSSVDLVLLLKDVLNIAQQSFPKSIIVRQNFPVSDSPGQTHGTIWANSTRLHQVFMNLCINARDAMPDGGILTITIAHSVVDEAIARKNWDAQVGEYVVVTIADTGTGIAPEIRDRIFDPFFTTKEIGQGTGLGLSTVLGIVKNYGGFLQIVTEVGQGTLMKVYLPVTATAENPNEQSSGEELLEGNGELILVVDDDRTVRQSTQSLLESHQYRTLGANNGAIAIELYTQHLEDIKLVILDVMMPHMDGVHLIGKLKSINP